MCRGGWGTDGLMVSVLILILDPTQYEQSLLHLHQTLSRDCDNKFTGSLKVAEIDSQIQDGNVKYIIVCYYKQV